MIVFCNLRKGYSPRLYCSFVVHKREALNRLENIGFVTKWDIFNEPVVHLARRFSKFVIINKLPFWVWVIAINYIDDGAFVMQNV